MKGKKVENLTKETDKEVEHTQIKPTSEKQMRDDSNLGVLILVCIIGVSLGIILEIINVQNRKVNIDSTHNRRTYWVYSAYSDVENKEGLLKHVHLVLERLGYEQGFNETWTLLWSHDYPFRVLQPIISKLKSHQRVNHFPGTGFITNKVDLATTDSKYIPKAFKLPNNKTEFLRYAKENVNALFLEKHNQHRGVYLKNVSKINLNGGESFVQEFIQKPFLVDGHKFDIGVYVVVTSVDPLRVYWYKGDVLFRYCPAKYYPFDANILDKYVIGDDYLPTWEVPSLAHPYTALGFGMKGAFDHYAQSKGKNTELMWQEVQEAIADVFVKKEKHIIDALKSYPSQDNYFEMMRFDLIVDEDLKVYLLEANMSPNLSSAHFPPNQLLYEQVLYNLFSLTGVANHMGKLSNDTNVQNMLSAQKNIAVYSDECSTICRESCHALLICELCKPCLTNKMKRALLSAYREHLHRADFARLFPRNIKPNSRVDNGSINLNKINKLQHYWYQGKCNSDITWCS
ncbi:probable tubulin polyglutamylase ttll-15 isoform X2 [Leptidea sinapis]|uniref:probable tubulin polyglutamylase ttll-15 isoform X2 n=1 Tax=Leptidea sinapis TaxID=189913 RepID=UPI0021C2839F|nr:probable tubulin polyglutamylase ttll-15 isoform X2 [Leptidea sinapis]